jgi:hypothetical protein
MFLATLSMLKTTQIIFDFIICLLTLYPSHQGVTAAFKACYLQLIMRHLISGSVGESKPIIKQMWKDYNIKMLSIHCCVLEQSGSRKHYWHLEDLAAKMYDFKSFDNNVEGIQHKTVNVALQRRFSESGIQEVAAPHSRKRNKQGNHSA